MAFYDEDQDIQTQKQDQKRLEYEEEENAVKKKQEECIKMVQNQIKKLEASIAQLKEQNKKLFEIGEGMDRIKRDVKKGNEYQKIIDRGFFGSLKVTLRGLFGLSKSSTSNKKGEDKKEKNIANDVKKQEKTSTNLANFEGEASDNYNQNVDYLVKEVTELGKKCRELHEQAENGNKLSEEVIKKADEDLKRLKKLNEKHKKYFIRNGVKFNEE